MIFAERVKAADFERQLSEAVALIEMSEAPQLRERLKREALDLAGSSTMSVPEALYVVTGKRLLEKAEGRKGKR